MSGLVLTLPPPVVPSDGGGGAGGGAVTETGLWFPEFKGNSGGSGQDYSSIRGTWIRQDRLMTVSLDVWLNSKGTLLGTFAVIEGLPVPMSSSYGFTSVSAKFGMVSGIDPTWTEIGFMAYGGEPSRLRLIGRAPSGTTGNLLLSAIVLTDPLFQGTFSYLID